jgi:AcrR family transcriptional regulator
MGTARRTYSLKKTALTLEPVGRGEVVAARGGPASSGTRDLLITTAERLFAEQGISVSNRQIGEAAGQANNSVVGYHFGTRSDLVLAIVRRHALDIEQRRAVMLERVSRSKDLYAWLACLVMPIAAHLDSLGAPSWYARFLAQAVTDPAWRQVVFDETLASPSMRATIEGIVCRLPVLPPEIHEERGDMTRHVILHACAERERALQAGTPTPRATWEEAALGMIDALVGLWSAPVRQTPSSKGASLNPTSPVDERRKDRK